MKLSLYLTLRIKINSNCTKDVNLGAKIIKLLEENFVKNLRDTGVGNDYMDTTPKSKVTKPNSPIKKWAMD